MTRVLVLCTGNSCRSQMAEGYLRLFLSDTFEVVSAGTEQHRLNPRAVQVMMEDGVDISHHQSKKLDTVLDRGFDVVLTVCDHAKEHCPVLPGTFRSYHQSFPDPAKATGTEEEVMKAFRTTRDAVRTYCQELAVELM